MVRTGSGVPVAGLLVLGALLAGCAGAAEDVAGPLEDSGPVQAETAAPSATTGSIEGLVQDDEGFPLVGVALLVIETDQRTVSDPSGRYTFNDVAPGTRNVAATSLGYSTATRPVKVEAGLTSQVDFTLKQVASVAIEPFEEIWPDSGHFDCQWRPTTYAIVCGTVPVNPLWSVTQSTFEDNVWTNDKTSFEYDAAPGVVSAFHEIVWDPSSLDLGDILRVTFANATGGGYYCSAKGGSPLKLHWERNWEEGEPDDTLPGACDTGSGSGNTEQRTMTLGSTRFVTEVGVGGSDYHYPPTASPGSGFGGFMYQQRFDIWFSLFHWKPAPEDFSALEDAE